MSTAPPDWDHHRSFLAVLRTGSLSAAARSLGLTQPTVARHIALLEQALGGVSLFLRSPQGLSPTALALRLQPQAEAMAAAAQAMARMAEGDEACMTGAVRITASEVIGVEVLPPILKALRDDHPGLVVELVLSNSTADLLRRDADIAVRMLPPNQDALIQKRAGIISLGLHAHPAYLAAHGTPETFADLAGHAVIGFDQDVQSGRIVEAQGLPVNRAAFAWRTDSHLAQLAAIRAGCGIGFCQMELARRAPRLSRLLADRITVPLETWITMHEDLRHDRRMRVVFDHLHAAIAAYADA